MAPILVWAAIQAGLRLDGAAVFRFPSRDLRGAGPGGLPGAFEPLSPGFISAVLGRDETRAGRQAGRVPGAPVVRPETSFRLEPTRPTVVDHPLTNDDIAKAREVSSIPYQARTDSSGAGREGGEAAPCSSTGGTVWYRYTAPARAGFLASTFGTSRPATIAVFERTSSEDRLIDCDQDARGNAHVSFTGARGRTYLFQVSMPVGGPMRFNLEPRGRTTVITGAATGAGDDVSSWPDVSADGRFVAFHSLATNLTRRPDRNRCNHGLASVAMPAFASCYDVYVHDRLTKKNELISVARGGGPGNDGSLFPSISADGRFVSFTSWATDLPIGRRDLNDGPDIFVRDRHLDRTLLVSIGPGGRQSRTPTYVEDQDEPLGITFDKLLYDSVEVSSISADGRYVAFSTRQAGLSRKDEDGRQDVFRHDLRTGRTEQVSIARDGTDITEMAYSPDISSDGSLVAFVSNSPNLTAGDRNTCLRTPDMPSCVDVFVRDMRVGRTTLISRTPWGQAANAESGAAAISGDGRFVAFLSEATNIAEVEPSPDPTAPLQAFYLHDRRSGKTIRISPPDYTNERYLAAKDFASLRPAISFDGRIVAYSNRGGTNTDDGVRGLYIFDRLTRVQLEVSVATDGTSANDRSQRPALTADGMSVAFTSTASNLDRTPDECLDTEPAPSCADVFMHTLPTSLEQT